MCYWQLRKGGTTVYWCDEGCGRGTAWARQRKMRYMCSRKGAEKSFPVVSTNWEIANQSQGEYKDICSCEMYLGNDTRSPLYCYVQNQQKHTHYRGKAVSKEQQIHFGFALRTETQVVEGIGFGGPFSNPLQVKLLECWTAAIIILINNSKHDFELFRLFK